MIIEPDPKKSQAAADSGLYSAPGGASPNELPGRPGGQSPSNPGVPIPAAWAASAKRPDIPPAGRGVMYPQLEPGDIPASAPLPMMVQDPFDPSMTINLAEAPVPNFNLVDGTVAIATDPQMPFV